MSNNESPDHGAEFDLLYRAMEKRVELFNKEPQLLVGEIQEIADYYTDVIKNHGKKYFMAFAAGCLVERYGISLFAAYEAVKIWNTK